MRYASDVSDVMIQPGLHVCSGAVVKVGHETMIFTLDTIRSSINDTRMSKGTSRGTRCSVIWYTRAGAVMLNSGWKERRSGVAPRSWCAHESAQCSRLE